MSHVLVVDDSVDTCRVLQAFLKRAGHDVTCVTSAGDAIPAMHGPRPVDVIISDLMMPYESGIDLLKQVRSDPRTRELPVVMYSAVSERRYIQEAMDAGATDYWLKGALLPGDMHARLQAYLPNPIGWAEAPDAHPVSAHLEA